MGGICWSPTDPAYGGSSEFVEGVAEEDIEGRCSVKPGDLVELVLVRPESGPAQERVEENSGRGGGC